MMLSRNLVKATRAFPKRSLLAIDANAYGTTRRSRSLPLNTIVKFVPQQECWIVERFGKYSRTLTPGLNFLMPFIESIRYVQSLKEITIEIPSQSAITNDNVTLHLDGVLYLKVVDPYKASYGIEDAEYAMTQLAQTTMRSEIGKMQLDQTFKERDLLNHAIVSAMNEACAHWGILCMRYEIRDMNLPEEIGKAMQMQASAERRKRAQILESEGQRQSQVNIAEGKKQAAVLESEAQMTSKINLARGDAEAIKARAVATAENITIIANAIRQSGGVDAVAMSVAEKYVEAFSKIAKEGTTILLPSNPADPSSMITQALSIFKRIGTNDTNTHTHELVKELSAPDRKSVV